MQSSRRGREYGVERAQTARLRFHFSPESAQQEWPAKAAGNIARVYAPKLSRTAAE